MLLCVATGFILLSVLVHDSIQQLESPNCTKGAACSTCFGLLVTETIASDENQFKLQKTFFPPNTLPPTFVLVHYSFSNGEIDDSENETWIWTTSPYFLIHPPPLLQYTSLFFSHTTDPSAELFLTLNWDCHNASEDYKLLLTQRVSVFIVVFLNATVEPP